MPCLNWSMASSILAVLLTNLQAVAADVGQDPFTVVLDGNNLPYSNRRGLPEGADVEVARLLALQMGARLEIQWADTETTGLLSHLFKEESAAQFAVGVAIDPRTVEDEQRVSGKILYSKPYASTRYVLVTRKAHRELPVFKSVGLEQVGVEIASVASYTLWDRGFILRGMESQQKMLEALARGEVGYAVLWSNAGWLIHEDPEWSGTLKVQSARPGISGLSWNLAVAVGRENEPLLARIDAAIGALLELDAFKSLFFKYHLAHFPPFQEEVTP